MLEPITEETLARVRDVCEIEEESLIDAGRKIKRWLEEQELLKEFDEKRLQLLYLQSKKRMDKVHERLKYYSEMKIKIPDVLQNRDPCLPWFKQANSLVYWVPLPKATEDLCRVTVTGLLDKDPSNYVLMDIIKMDNMVHETRMWEDFMPFEILIVSLKDSYPRHLAHYTLPALRKIKAIFLDGLPIRPKSLHIVHAPTYVGVVVNLVKLILKPKMFSRIHVHLHGVGNLHKFVSPEVLPEEYGGTAGSVLDMWEQWKKKIIERREFFIRETIQNRS